MYSVDAKTAPNQHLREREPHLRSSVGTALTEFYQSPYCVQAVRLFRSLEAVISNAAVQSVRPSSFVLLAGGAAHR